MALATYGRNQSPALHGADDAHDDAQDHVSLGRTGLHPSEHERWDAGPTRDLVRAMSGATKALAAGDLVAAGRCARAAEALSPSALTAVLTAEILEARGCRRSALAQYNLALIRAAAPAVKRRAIAGLNRIAEWALRLQVPDRKA